MLLFVYAGVLVLFLSALIPIMIIASMVVIFILYPALWEIVLENIWWGIQKLFIAAWPIILTKILHKIIYPKNSLEMLKNRELRCFWLVSTLAYWRMVAAGFIAAIWQFLVSFSAHVFGAHRSTICFLQMLAKECTEASTVRHVKREFVPYILLFFRGSVGVSC